MALVTLDEAKEYLRVDSADEDAMTGVLLDSAVRLCCDVARLSDGKWEIINSGEDPDGVFLTHELSHIRELMKIAILFTVGYLFEHREGGDHKSLTLSLRSLLFSIREGVV